jgi:MFS family permease
VSQVCALLCGAGIALVAGAAALPAAPLALVAVAAVVIGLGYGPITPASSQVLARTAPAARMSLVFSIKQTGVPAGAALAGAALPTLALASGWRATFVAVAILGAIVVLAAQPARHVLDADRLPARALSVAGALAPLRVVFASSGLAELSLVGFTYAATQVCLMSFTVVYFTETLGFPLHYAGYALTVANFGGIAGRIGWGAVADHFVAPRRLLGLLGLATACFTAVTLAFTPTWPWIGLLAVCAILGATAIGWNGVHLAEVARLAPKGQAGAITGACGFVTFAGVVFGPPSFALLAAMTESYRTGFAVCGLGTGIIGLYLLASKRA